MRPRNGKTVCATVRICSFGFPSPSQHWALLAHRPWYTVRSVQSSRTEKIHLISYVAVIRGVALEVDMETYHIHEALKRIAARQTSPRLYLSDNAPQFVLLHKHLQINAISDLTWKFIPEHSPWFGGAYERLNAILKTSLHRCLCETPHCGPSNFELWSLKSKQQ